MKMNERALFTAILLLTMGGMSIVAYGVYWTSSNVVHVDVQYAVDLSTVSIADSTITLKATVTNNGAPVRAGIVVDFYVSIDGGTSTWFKTQLTDGSGIAQTTYIVTANGGYDFNAIATIP